MSHLLGSLIQYSLIYCFVVGLILCLRGPVSRIAGARWAYALWFALFIPLVIPVIAWLVPLPLASPLIESISVPETVTSTASSDLLEIFVVISMCIWLGGVFISAWRVAYVNQRLKRSLYTSRLELTRVQQREINQICSKLRIFPIPVVRFSPDMEGPALFGILNPVVYLPHQFFDRFTARERTLMMFHELCHYRRKDAWWNILFCVLNCLFWFNPLFRFAEHRFRLDQEHSCDQFVLWDEPKAQRALYAGALLKIAAPTEAHGLVHFQSNAPEVMARMTMMEHHKKTTPQSVFGFAGLALVLFLTLIVTAPVVEANDPIGLVSSWCTTYKGLGL